MASSSSKLLISWSDSLDALEATNPCAFNHYYHFHSMYGLKERDLSPYERFSGIYDHCESTGDNLAEDFIKAIADYLSIEESDLDSYSVGEEGFDFS